MLPKNLKRGRWHTAASVLLLLPLLLTACGGKNANATPTLGVEAVYTAAYQTLIAQQATQLALTPPTSTPLPPTALPTLAPASPLPTFSFASPTPGGAVGGTACDSSAFVADVTIPDNTVIDPGKAFTKTWTLLNNGTCTWSTSYKLAFQGGDQMGGATTPLTTSVGPGSSINISVKLTAPTTNGTYKGTWQMQNASNQFFGVAPFVLIKVGTGATATAGPSPTGSAACTTTCTISGNLGVTGSNIKLNISNMTGVSGLNIDEASGDYSFQVTSGWSGTIKPKKGTYVFDPASITFTNVTTNLSNQNFSVSQGSGGTQEPTATTAP